VQFVPLIVAMLVYAICHVISSRFLIRRSIYGTFAILFDAFTASQVIWSIWGPASDLVLPFWLDCVVPLPFAVIGYLFTWRFAVWHLRSVAKN